MSIRSIFIATSSSFQVELSAPPDCWRVKKVVHRFTRNRLRVLQIPSYLLSQGSCPQCFLCFDISAKMGSSLWSCARISSLIPWWLSLPLKHSIAQPGIESVGRNWFDPLQFVISSNPNSGFWGRRSFWTDIKMAWMWWSVLYGGWDTPELTSLGRGLNTISLFFITKPKLFVVKSFSSLGWWYRAAWQKEVIKNRGSQCGTVHVTALVCSLQYDAV